MDELRPGLWHWVTHHPNIETDVSSYFHVGSGTLIDPFTPKDDSVLAENPPRRIVMTNRHHVRDVAELSKRYAVPVLAPVGGLAELSGEGGLDIDGFEVGDRFEPGISVLPNGAITAEEVTLWIDDVGPGAMHFADGIVHYGERIGFVPDSLLGEDAEDVKRAIREAAANLLDHDFDDLLFAHGAPILGGGHTALTEFAHHG